MTRLSTHYMGLKLSNPIIAASSGLSKDINGIMRLSDAGVGAIVLKSLFEEQIQSEVMSTYIQSFSDRTEAYDYLKGAISQKNTETYLNLISNAKKSTATPIIASLNCVTSGDWVKFARQIEDAGADGLELNISVLPFDHELSSEQNEKVYFEIIDSISSNLSIPIAIKMGGYSAGLANLIKRISWTRKVKAVVLFNRYYQPNIDINTKTIISTDIYSNPSDITLPIRWLGLLSNQFPLDFAGSTGIYSGADVIKMLLVGAKTAQTASALYKHGAAHVGVMLAEITSWMDKNEYSTIADFRGILCQSNMGTKAYERVQFMKYYGGIE